MSDDPHGGREWIYLSRGGEEIQNILIIEEGSIQETKFAVATENLEESRNSLRELPHHQRATSLAQIAITVDTITGRGMMTGLLHNFQEGNRSFVTVSAAASSTKVWLIDGEDFRQVISSTPEYALQMMVTLSREVRQGTKSSLSTLVARSTTPPQVKEEEEEQEEKYQRANVVQDRQNRRVCKVLCYDSSSWVSENFAKAIRRFNEMHERTDSYRIKMDFINERLNEQTATFAAGYNVVCLFVNDQANAAALRTLSLMGVRMIALRCIGHTAVDTKAARAYGLTVARVPSYSPHAVAEMAITLLLAVNRKIHQVMNRIRMANFTLDKGLMGIDVHGKVVGVMGTGRIGRIICSIMIGFGAQVLCYDIVETEDLVAAGARYVTKEEILQQSDILFLMMSLGPETYHTINDDTLPLLKKGVILVNTSCGGLIDTKTLIRGLQSGRIAGAGLDVYENEQDYFFHDWSARTIPDDDLVSLVGNNNVVLTCHQAFFTKEAVEAIVNTTIGNIHDYFHNKLEGEAHPNNCIPPLPKDILALSFRGSRDKDLSWASPENGSVDQMSTSNVARSR